MVWYRSSKMELKIKNIGMIHSAELNVDGISVVTGNNDSGKSTIGKALFSLCHGIQSYEKKIEADAMEYILGEFYDSIKASGHIDAEDISALMAHIRIKLRELFLRKSCGGYNLEAEIEKIQNINLEGNGIIVLGNSIELFKKKIREIQSRDFLDRVKKQMVERVFFLEFSKSINNVYNEDVGEVRIDENSRYVSVRFQHNSLIGLEGELACSDSLSGVFSEINFINTPFILDEISVNSLFKDNIYTHQKDIINKLLMVGEDESNIVKYALKNEEKKLIEKAITKVLEGNIVKKRGMYYQTNGKEFSVDVLATGLKSYAILKILLDNGYLRPNSLLILDEPEVHLHPSWQLLFAELLVLFYKELGIKVLLATHSPYFLQAIEAYSKKYEIQEKTHFYLSKKHGNSAVLENIDNDLEQTYKLMAEPILILQSMQDELEV